MRDVQFENGEYYHVYTRGVDKRVIFKNEADFERMAQNLYLFNDAGYSWDVGLYEKIARITGAELFEQERDRFVSVCSWTLLPNHYHFLIRQEQDQGISKFVHKLNKTHSRLFNENNDRVGTLFEGPYHCKHINNETYFWHIVLYIHLNILDMTGQNWRDGIVNDWEKALIFMDNWKWSSHRMYRGIDEPFPIIDQDFLVKMFPTPETYTAGIRSWSMRNIDYDLSDYLGDFL
jgi:putative transposase